MESICKEIRELASKRNEIVSENKNLEYDITTAKEQLSALCEDIGHLKEEVTYLKKEIANQKRKAFEDEMEKKNAEIQDKQCENRQLCKNNKSLQNCKTSLEEEVNYIREHIKALENTACNLYNKFDAIEQCVEKLDIQNAEKDRNVKETNRNLVNMKNSVDKQSALLKEKCYKVDFMMDNLNNNESCIESLLSKVKALERKVFECKEVYSKLQAKIHAEGCKSEQLGKRICNSHDVDREIQQQLKFYERELNELKQQRMAFLQEIKEEISKLKRGEEGCARRCAGNEHLKVKKNEMVKLKKACEASLMKCGIPGELTYAFPMKIKKSAPSKRRKFKSCDLSEQYDASPKIYYEDW